MTRIYIDLETYSTVDLRKATPYAYCEDPEFMILMAAWCTDEDPKIRVAFTDEEIKAIPGLWDYWDDTIVRVAHNAAFERICLSRFAGLSVGSYLPIRGWHDTQAVAAEYGWPQQLALLAKALGGEQKDEAGTRLINWFCKPDKYGRRRLPEDHPEKWEQFVAYCVQDVVTLRDVDQKMGDFPIETEREVYFADQWINDFGIAIDVDLARAAVEAGDMNRMAEELELSSITGLGKPNNPVTLRKWFQETARIKMPDMRVETVEAAITRLEEKGLTDLDGYRALEIRQELALTASKKFSSALDAVSSDGRLRGSLRFFGAHTGRWTGRGTQIQNLPREAFTKVDPKTGKEEYDDAAVIDAIMDLLDGDGASALDLKRLVRPLFIVDGCVVDYAAIEARVIAWLAGETWALEAFRAGRDIYVETAERMGGLSRSQGKVAVLALGYAGGVNSLKAMAGSGFYYNIETQEILDSGSLGASAHEITAGSLKIKKMPDDQIKAKLVDPWRRANSRIVQLWADLDDAVAEGGQVGEYLSIDRDGEEMALNLPSGRAIHYHGVRWEKYVVRDPQTGKPKHKVGWRYDDPKRPGRIGTYGGRLSENATQAVARDLLAEALVRLINEGYTPVGHVHDEVLVEGCRDWEEVSRVMSVTPKWATNLPVTGDGFATMRYRKG